MAARIALPLILSNRTKERAGEISTVSGGTQVVFNALAGLRIDRQRQILSSLANEMQRLVSSVGVIVLHQQARNLRPPGASLQANRQDRAVAKPLNRVSAGCIQNLSCFLWR